MSSTSSPEKRLQPFLQPLIFIGIVPRCPTTFWKSPCRNLVFPFLICLILWFGTVFSILKIFFCHSTDPATAHKASFLDVIEDFRRNLQIFCGAFNICLFCWKARQIPRLLDRARELFGKKAQSAVEQSYSPPVVAYFVWLCVLYACVVSTAFTNEYLESFHKPAKLLCFGTHFLEWDSLEIAVKVLEMVVTTYVTGLLCGVMLLLYDGCRVIQAKIATFLTGKGETLRSLRRLQEQVIAFNDECNGVFGLLHLLVMSDAVSVTIVAVGLAAQPALQEALSAEASIHIVNGTTTMRPPRDAASLLHAFFLYVVGMVTMWGIIGSCVVALVVLLLANLALEFASQRVIAELETLESMYAVGNLSVDSSDAGVELGFCWREAEDDDHLSTVAGEHESSSGFQCLWPINTESSWSATVDGGRCLTYFR
ncbi:hypothetical protein BV898_04715 [Hypsibius exemplaris]|uniref:Uncharacterized protein n=1 Tax=Hypsibius exemplaris TaxID=2072580 RepID=A0A1W0X1A9_HYPEX|nr:hypothetical protein BV898_04715 [Hypsibius exemplaris]